jgi:phospholipid-binding lipoprotein MlaA
VTRRLISALLILLVAGCATTAAPPEDRHPDDPWEPFNRSVYTFNRAADRAVLRPVARGYDRITPAPVKSGISNFFRNLRSPVIMTNLLLQGRGSDLGEELHRFYSNTVYGIGGLFDVASAGGIDKNESDFGQTLANWGWEDSRFVMLPLLGPSTVRDTAGRGVDSISDMAWRLAYQEGSFGLLALRIVEIRAALLPLDAELAAAYDEYSLIRDGWMQRRNYQVFGGEVDVPDYDAWLDEDEDWDDW